MLRGELPSPDQATLLEAVLVAGVDHGPQAPSVAIARMASTCGVGLNSAIASGVNVLGDVHGGAGAQCMEMLTDIEIVRTGRAVSENEAWLADAVAAWRAAHGKFLPGFGHRFHSVDPRSPRLMALLDDAKARGVVEGRFLALGRAVEEHLGHGRATGGVPMNIDGSTAIVLLELGFPPPLGRGVFVLSRSVGICAHAWEQSQQGARIKGPLPPSCGYTYDGPAARHLASIKATPASRR
jgi:citrate synthase